MIVDLSKIGTERRNERTMNIDTLSTTEILNTINEEDKLVPLAIEKAIPQIARLVDAIVEKFMEGGRLIYIGAGTSGRIGILDAVECRPTFGVSDDEVQGLLAGGMDAMVKAVEGAEDNKELAVLDLEKITISKKDVVVGITASGRTPYAVSGVMAANKMGIVTGCITTSPNSEIASVALYPVEAITGAEPITGSTRMKSGTAQKLICNMITTAAMIKMGKVYENLMIDMQPTNQKLHARAKSIVMELTGVTSQVAEDAINKYKSVKKVLFSLITGITNEVEIEEALSKSSGHLRNALNESMNR